MESTNTEKAANYPPFTTAVSDSSLSDAVKTCLFTSSPQEKTLFFMLYLDGLIHFFSLLKPGFQFDSSHEESVDIVIRKYSPDAFENDPRDQNTNMRRGVIQTFNRVSATLWEILQRHGSDELPCRSSCSLDAELEFFRAKKNVETVVLYQLKLISYSNYIDLLDLNPAFTFEGKRSERQMLQNLKRELFSAPALSALKIVSCLGGSEGLLEIRKKLMHPESVVIETVEQKIQRMNGLVFYNQLLQLVQEELKDVNTLL
jgi:hypothetical protein